MIDTFGFAGRHELAGRSSEIEKLYKELTRSDAKVILLEGELGVGKTALANRLIEMMSAGTLTRRFDRHVMQSAYQETWGRVLSQVAEKLIGGDIILKATKSEIEDRVLAFCKEKSTFLVIDNLESGHREDAVSFVKNWIESHHNSVLLITSREKLAVGGQYVYHLTISGLADHYSQLELLGGTLRQRFGDESLLTHVINLKGIPLNLLYLRWLDPKTEHDLKRHVSGLVEGTFDKSLALEDALTSISCSPTHFMALGVIRQLQFNERLLAFFWDWMGGGSSEAYIEIREKLVSSRLLIPVQGMQVPAHRINEDIHRQLYKALITRIGGEERVAAVHFFASEYYRRVFESSETPSLDALDAFVYHCFASGEYRRAYGYIFESDILPRLHQAGMTLQLQTILQAFLDNSSEFSSLQQCKLLIEMTHTCNDLSQFQRSLDLMNRAESLLQESCDELNGSERTELLRRIWYYSGVAYSNTGRSEQCLRSYFKIVSAASEEPRSDPLACLSLGYLAHDLKYRDIAVSLEYASTAVELARQLDDPRILAKNLCSLGESYTYARDLDHADACFKEASALCAGESRATADRRELGRILKNWGVVALIRAEWEVAINRLTEARRISESVGDRRRVATSDLYAGVLQYRIGKQMEAEALVLSAIKALYALGDGRYLVPAVMTYAWWKNPDYCGQLRKLPDWKNCEPIAEILAEISKEERFEIYAAFWRDCFRHVLL